MAGRRRKWQRGKLSERRDPVWDPILELFPEDIDDFMWMGEVLLTDGTQIQLYKHYWTRRYVRVDLGGRIGSTARAPLGGGRGSGLAAGTAFRFKETRGNIVRRNEWFDCEKL